MSDEDQQGEGEERPEGDGQRSKGDERRRREPLSGLTDEIERRRRRKDEDALDDTFEDMSVGTVDMDAVWEQLGQEGVEPTVEPPVEPANLAGGSRSGETATETENSTVGSDVDFDVFADRDVRVIEKRTFCQGCRYFSDPPTVACSHEGTEILELVDVDHFRVVDCPMVAEAEQLTDELSSDGSALQ